jgi:hypothetical protein
MAWSRKQPTKTGGVIAIVLGAVFAIGGVILGVTLANDQHDFEFLRDNGQHVQGQIIGTRHEEKRSRRSTSHYYYLTVSFRHPSGQPVSQEVMVEDNAYAYFSGANLGNPLTCTVLADPARADHFAVQEAIDEQIADKSGGALMAVLIGLGFGLILAVSGVFTFKKAAALQAANTFANPYLPQGYQQPMPYPQQGQAPPYMPPQQRLQQNPYWQPPRQT